MPILIKGSGGKKAPETQEKTVKIRSGYSYTTVIPDEGKYLSKVNIQTLNWVTSKTPGSNAVIDDNFGFEVSDLSYLMMLFAREPSVDTNYDYCITALIWWTYDGTDRVIVAGKKTADGSYFCISTDFESLGLTIQKLSYSELEIRLSSDDTHSYYFPTNGQMYLSYHGFLKA